MLTETFQSIGAAAHRVIKDWRSMALLAIVYASFLGALYFFLLVREASLVQVVLTFALAVVAPILFFVLQAMIADAVSTAAEDVSVVSLLRRSLTSFWKLVLISLPLIALAILLAYLLNKMQNRFGVTATPPDLPRPRSQEGARAPIDWKHAFVSSLRYLVFGLALPLAAIHLWLATVRDGLGGTIRKLVPHLGQAFAPQSVLIYIAGFFVFAMLPYFLLFRTTPSSHAWLEIGLLVARLIIVFALSLFGWVITVRALSLVSTKLAAAPADEAT